MDRVQEYTVSGKNFMYIDFSGITDNDTCSKLVEYILPIIEKYPPDSLYTITNISDTRFDSVSKKIMAGYMEHNSRYVKYGAVIGLDGIKKIMAKSAFRLSGRTNMHFAFSKEQATEWLLEQSNQQS